MICCSRLKNKPNIVTRNLCKSVKTSVNQWLRNKANPFDFARDRFIRAVSGTLHYAFFETKPILIWCDRHTLPKLRREIQSQFVTGGYKM